MPSEMFPFEIFGWLTALLCVPVIILLIALWTPSYNYVPKRLKRPPDKSSLSNRVRAWINIIGLTIQQSIERLPTTRRRTSRRTNRLSSNGKHLFSLRLRRKGFGHRKKGRSAPKPPTCQQKKNRQRLIALASLLREFEGDSMVFDYDSFLLALDNCSSHCMTNDESDFVDTPISVCKDILGIGKAQAVKMGTVKWSIEDDKGRSMIFYSPRPTILRNCRFACFRHSTGRN